MTRETFIFTKKFPQRLYRHIAFWVMYYLFSIATYFHDFLERTTFPKWMAVQCSEAFFHILTQMAFCYTVLYLFLPLWRRKKYATVFFGMIALSGCTFLIYFGEHMFIFKRIHFWGGMPFRGARIMVWFTMISFFSHFPVSSGLAITLSLLKRFYLKQKENQLLVRENANAELQLLKAQVHPHFLFNTLNNIYSFALSNSPEASPLVSKLSDTIHYMITDCNSNAVPLEKELKMLEDYIGLEKVRYGDRLEIRQHIDCGADAGLIAPLLMIPFVENCFKHGSSMMTGKQWIEMSIQVKDHLLTFSVSNSKPATVLPASSKTGIGLVNVRKRLSLLYPGKHQLDIAATESVYRVHMQIVLQQQG